MRGRTEHVHTVAACMLGLHIDVCVSKVCMLMSACLFVCVCVCVCVCVWLVYQRVCLPQVYLPRMSLCFLTTTAMNS